MAVRTPSPHFSQSPFQITERFEEFVRLNPNLISGFISRVSKRLDECNNFRYLHMSEGIIYPYASPAFIAVEGVEELKKGVILVNCAREEIVNKSAVIKAIKSGKLFGYGVETEIMKPIPKDDEYL